jgi:putative ABC transport system permease protein
MPFFSTIKGSFRAVFKGATLDRDLDEELQSYLDLLIEEKITSGMDPEAARRQALIELGGTEQVKAGVRETRHGATLDTLLQDIRFTLRMLRKNPAFAVVVVLTLAIGIGANTALFGTIKALLLSQLPYEEPDRLVATTKTYSGRSAGPVSRLDYLDFRRLNHSLEGLAALVPSRFAITGGESPVSVSGSFVTWNLFPTLGVTPIRGRFFSESEETAGGANVVIISHDLWQGRFGGSEQSLGSDIVVDGTARQIVGIMPPGFRFMYEGDLWRLLDRDSTIDEDRDSHSHRVVGRLKDGVSLEQAQMDIDAVAKALEKEYPDTNKDKGLRLWDLHEYMVAHVRPSLNLLIVTTGLLLLIACGNVAGLFLARGQQRVSEMAMRSALGASRRRLIRQLMTESVILTLLAGLGGIAVALLLHRLLLRLLPMGDPGVPLPTIDAGVLLFALVISVVTGLVVGIIPALRATSLHIWRQIERSNQSSEGRRSTRLRTAMVVVQVAISASLLIGCGLLIRSMVNLATVDLGFDPENVAGATIGIPSTNYPTPAERTAFFSSLIAELEALPVVTSAASVSHLPIAWTGTDWPIWHAAQPRPEPRESEMALARMVSPGYLETIGIPLLRGRGIADFDTGDSAKVVVISKAVAEEMFPDEDPIGRMVKLGWSDDPFEIVGVVGNAKLNGVRSDFDWAMYLASGQTMLMEFWLVVRSDGDPSLLAEPIRRILRTQDPDAVIGDLRTMTSIVEGNLTGFRVVMLALSLLAAAALLLTAVGLYGVLTYHVSQRSNEFGVRSALGATSREIVGLIMKQGLLMIGAGLVLGLLGAFAGSRLIQSLLYETAVFDPATFIFAAVFLGSVALIACLVPAWRAGRINPVEALRRE